MKNVTPQQVLDCPMRNDNYEGTATTVRAFLVDLLRTLWEEKEGFSGKRPFGNSGWEFRIYEGLARAGLVNGAFDEDGYLDEVDDEAADQLVTEAIASLLPA